MSGQYGNRATRVDFQELNEQFVPVYRSQGPESRRLYEPQNIRGNPTNKLANSIGEGSNALTGSKRVVNDFVTATTKKTLKTHPPPPLNVIHNLRLGRRRYFVFARDRSSESSGLVLIEKVSYSQAAAQIKTMALLKHDNILKAIHTFSIGKHYMVAWPFMCMTLQEMAGHRSLKDLIVASILGQVLQGLQYLHKEKLTHGHLTCSNSMIDYTGNVKISVQDGSTEQSDVSEENDVQGIIQLTMELVIGIYDEKISDIGLDDPVVTGELKTKKPLDDFDQTPLTLAFLLFLKQVTRLQGVWSQALLKLDWAPVLLVPLVWELMYTMKWEYKPGDMHSLI